MSFREIALPLAERGFRVFPLIPEQKRPVKLEEGDHVDWATTEKSQILKWDVQAPDTNVGSPRRKFLSDCRRSVNHFRYGWRPELTWRARSARDFPPTLISRAPPLSPEWGRDGDAQTTPRKGHGPFFERVSMSKPRVLICVLSSLERSGWINPFLMQNLLTIARDMGFNVAIEPVIDKCPVDFARYFCVVMARERHADSLLMIDADQSFWPGYNALDIAGGGGKRGNCVRGYEGFRVERLQRGENPIEPNFDSMEGIRNDGEFFTVSHIGTGAMFIRRHICELIPGPWFFWRYKEGSELHETDGVLSEDWISVNLSNVTASKSGRTAALFPTGKLPKLAQ